MYTPIHVYIYIYICMYLWGLCTYMWGVGVFAFVWAGCYILVPPPLAKVLWEILNPRYDLILK